MVILALGKARSHREPNVGCRGTDRPEWCNVLSKKPAWELWNGKVHCCDEADLLAQSSWMRRSHSTQTQSTASHCRLTDSTGECAVMSPLTGCQVTRRPCDPFWRYSEWPNSFWTDLVLGRRESLFLLVGIAPQFCGLPFSSSVTIPSTLQKFPWDNVFSQKFGSENAA